MNSFSIKLGMLSESGAASGCVLELRSCAMASEHGDVVEVVLTRNHAAQSAPGKPGPKGGTKAEESLGMLHVANLELSLRGVLVLTGGGAR